jgi:hypothetical protein
MTNYPLTQSGLERLWETEIIPLLYEKFFHEREIVDREFTLSSIQRSASVSGEELVQKRATA